MAKLTLIVLRAKKACRDQLQEFERRFGDSVEITAELCLSVAEVFDWNWAAEHLLGSSACAEYRRIQTAACVEYERIRASALAEYERIQVPALAEYERIQVPACVEYERIRASAWAEYRRIEACTFAQLFNS